VRSASPVGATTFFAAVLCPVDLDDNELLLLVTFSISSLVDLLLGL